MLGKLIKVGKFALGVVTAGLGAVAIISGSFTAIGAMGDDEQGSASSAEGSSAE